MSRLREHLPARDQEEDPGRERLADHRRRHRARDPAPGRDEQGAAGQSERAAAEERGDGDGHEAKLAEQRPLQDRADHRDRDPRGHRQVREGRVQAQEAVGQRCERLADHHRPDAPEGCLDGQAPERNLSPARAGDDGLRNGELHRAERDGEHRDDVEDGGERPVLRWAEQAADQDVEQEVKPADSRRGDDERPAAVAEQPGRDPPAPAPAVAAPVSATALPLFECGCGRWRLDHQVTVSLGCSDPTS